MQTAGAVCHSMLLASNDLLAYRFDQDIGVVNHLLLFLYIHL
jgi:hypothetical protein